MQLEDEGFIIAIMTAQYSLHMLSSRRNTGLNLTTSSFCINESLYTLLPLVIYSRPFSRAVYVA